MLVRYPLGEQRSGRLGSTIASRNASGNYLRTGTIPVNPNTARQVAVRLAVTQLSIAWAVDLTQDQRDAWNTYGRNVPWLNKLGETIYLKGLAHFVRSNVPRLQAGLARVDDGPTIFTVAYPEDDLGVTASEATQQFTPTGYDQMEWCAEDGAAQLYFVGIAQNPSREFFGGPYRLAHVEEGNSTTPVTSPYTAFDTPDFPFVENHRIWVRTRITRADGRLSPFATVNFQAAA